MASRKNTLRINDADVVDGGDIDLDSEEVYLADGTRLTEARVDELADEIRQKVGRGRPSLTGPGRRSPQLRLSVPAELRQQLEARAEHEHTTVSDIAREALERYLAS
ncbi:MAG TPA: hypothetical protein VGL39_23060 [Jatrophihabitantaceae bacterium]|jgi:hypothetical protein